MAKARGAQPLSSEDIAIICERLRLKDAQYAADLDARQFDFLRNKPRIKNWQEFKLVEEVKRAMVGLHDKTEITGSIVVRINNAAKRPHD